jgi:hypothetical protein
VLLVAARRWVLAGNNTAIKELTNQDHHAVTTVLGTEAEVDDLERHHQGDTTVQIIKEPNDPKLPTEHMTTKMMKRRWGRHALPIGFVSRQYLKVLNYPMISKNMMGCRSHSNGSQIIYKQ